MNKKKGRNVLRNVAFHSKLINHCGILQNFNMKKSDDIYPH